VLELSNHKSGLSSGRHPSGTIPGPWDPPPPPLALCTMPQMCQPSWTCTTTMHTGLAVPAAKSCRCVQTRLLVRTPPILMCLAMTGQSAPVAAMGSSTSPSRVFCNMGMPCTCSGCIPGSTAMPITGRLGALEYRNPGRLQCTCAPPGRPLCMWVPQVHLRGACPEPPCKLGIRGGLVPSGRGL